MSSPESETAACSQRRARPRILRRLALLAAAGVLAGCKSPAFMQPASSISSKVTHLYVIVLIMSALVFVLVEGLLLYNIFRYRKRPGDDTIPEQSYRNLRLEIIWTAIPVLLVAVLFVLTIRTANSVAAPPPRPNDLNLHITGHRWWWEFAYPDLGIVTANELHIPEGAVVQVDLDSVDVIHSFWVPQLAGKTDAIPGQTNHMWLTADETGEFRGHCAELCGLNHAYMRILVVVEPQEEFDAWVANQQQLPTQPQTDLQKQGAQIITTGICHNCHTLGEHEGLQPIGPNLTHLFSRKTFAGASFNLNEDNIRRWLQHSAEMKPGNDMAKISPSDEQVDALMAYLKTLK